MKKILEKLFEKLLDFIRVGEKKETTITIVNVVNEQVLENKNPLAYIPPSNKLKNLRSKSLESNIESMSLRDTDYYSNILTNIELL